MGGEVMQSISLVRNAAFWPVAGLERRPGFLQLGRQVALTGAEAAIRKHNQHIEQCNRVIEAESGKPLPSGDRR